MLWERWFSTVWELKGAFSRKRTFLWFVVCLIGMTIRTELFGVTSIVRAVGLDSKYYDRLLDLFHSSAIDINKLTQLWVKIIFSKVSCLVKFNNRYIIIGDGIKVAKSGKKMPGVKRLHQSSESNTKPEYITGHSFQALGILCGNALGYFSIPLISRICEGLKFDKDDKSTLLDKMILLIEQLKIEHPCYLVADAYYASSRIVKGLVGMGWHLVTRVKSNAVAYYPPTEDEQPKGKGRKKRYGKKVKLKELFNMTDKMVSEKSPIHGDKNIMISYLCIDLVWKSIARTVRFVLVNHPVKGKIILMSTDLSLTPLQIIEIYGYRFKIEVSFKHIIRIIGGYLYHFWMSSMKRRPMKHGDNELYKENTQYQNNIRRKVNAYHIFVQAAIITQGMMMLLAISYPKTIWNNFGSWMRTMNTNTYPSEFVTAYALRNTFFDFLADTQDEFNFKKFLRDKIILIKQKLLRLAA